MPKSSVFLWVGLCAVPLLGFAVRTNEEMSVTGARPAVAYPILERALIEKQDLRQVDAVSGASYSLCRLPYAVMVALTKARLAAAQHIPDPRSSQ